MVKRRKGQSTRQAVPEHARPTPPSPGETTPIIAFEADEPATLVESRPDAGADGATETEHFPDTDQAVTPATDPLIAQSDGGHRVAADLPPDPHFPLGEAAKVGATENAVPAIEPSWPHIPAADVPAVVPSAAPNAVPTRSRPIVDTVAEFSEVNATLLAFLRDERRAAMTHWRSLSGAKSPADLIRLQVDEMQRAADASLTCVSVLAKCAGRLAMIVGRP